MFYMNLASENWEHLSPQCLVILFNIQKYIFLNTCIFMTFIPLILRSKSLSDILFPLASVALLFSQQRGAGCYFYLLGGICCGKSQSEVHL